MKALNPRLTHEYGRGWVLCFDVDGESTGLAKMAVDKYKDGYVELTVEKWSDKRSLQANAYFHVLAGKIAAVLNASIDDTKKVLVHNYGSFARGADGKVMGAIVPQNTDIEKFYPYVRYIGTTENGLAQYLFYKRTHELTKDEMNRLISGTISEAQAMNIETLTPTELAAMMNRYKEGA